MALSSTDASLGIRAAEAVKAFLAQYTGLTGISWRRADDPRERPLPIGVVMVEGLDQSWAGSEEHEGVLVVMYENGRDVDTDSDEVTAEEGDVLANQTSHLQAVAKIQNALKDQPALRGYVNAEGVSRPCTQFHFYGLLNHQEPGTVRDGGRWITEFRRKIIVAGIDYPQ